MPTPLSSNPLRLARDPAGPIPPAQADLDAVASANRESARLDGSDTRTIFAARVAESLEGGRAAVLTPENRRRLVGAATRAGLRPFDANLVIAIVQDGARRGESVHNKLTSSRLRLVGAGRRERTRRPGPGAITLAAAGIALAAVAALIAWLTKK